MLIERGMKFKVEVLKNPLINTKVGHIVEITNVGKTTVEFKDTETNDYGLIEKSNIEKCFQSIWNGDLERIRKWR